MFDIFDKYFQKNANHKVKRDSAVESWQDGLVIPNDAALPDSKRILGGSLFILYIFLGISFLVILTRLVFLQLVFGDEFREKSENNHVRTYVTRALRGIIYDRDEKVLIENISRDDASVIPADLPRDPEERDQILSEISIILDVPRYEIDEKILASEFYYYPIVIKEDIDHETKLRLLFQYPDNKNGIVVVEDFYRVYPMGDNMSHIIGYLGRITEEEWEILKGRYDRNGEIGKVGLELAYESVLRGSDGQRKVNVNARGTQEDILATSQTEAGCDLQLTIDAELQKQVQDILQATLINSGTTAGVAIVMDPKNGHILSMVSLPTYDNNLFSNGITGDEVSIYNSWSESEDKPFLNRSLAGVYPPGSIFKLVTASAVLQGNAIEIGDYVNSPGTISVPNQFNPEEKFIYKDWKAEGHGSINIIEAIAESSDTYFYTVTGGFGDVTGLGMEKYGEYALQFGLGQALGIDLPGEADGVFPSEEWKRERTGQGWYTGDTYNLSIGQGYLLTTPLQAASWTSVIANGGTLYQPKIVRETRNCSEATTFQPLILNQNFIAPENIDAIQDGMRLSITSNDGTAKALRDFDIKVAGKTGTAQFNNNEKEHAWFTAYAPYNNPEVVVTVLVEGGGEGGDTALPVVRRIMSEYFSNN